MTKNVWVQPRTVVQQFVANEYVSACGLEPTSYKFVCDKEADPRYRDDLYYYDSRGRSHRLGGYAPCGETHIAPVTDEFPRGFIDWNDNGREDSGEECFVWLEYGWRGQIDDWHATSNMDPNSWEKNIS